MFCPPLISCEQLAPGLFQQFSIPKEEFSVVNDSPESLSPLKKETNSVASSYFPPEEPNFWIELIRDALLREKKEAAIKLLESALQIFPQNACMVCLLDKLDPERKLKEQQLAAQAASESPPSTLASTPIPPKGEEKIADALEGAPSPEPPSVSLAQEEEELKKLEKGISPRILNFIETELKGGKRQTLSELLIKEIADQRRLHHYENAAKMLEEYKKKYGADYLYEEQRLLLLAVTGGEKPTPKIKLLGEIADQRRLHQYTEAEKLLEQYKTEFGEDYLYEEQNILLIAVGGKKSDESSASAEEKAIDVGKIVIEAAADQRRLHNYPAALILLLQFKQKFGTENYQYQEESILLATVTSTEKEPITLNHSNAYDLADRLTSLGGKPWFGAALEYTAIALDGAPCNADYLFLRGTAAQGLAQFIKAEWLYREVLRIDPTYSKAVLNLARVLYGQGRVDESAYVYSEYVAAHSEDKEGLLEYSKALTSQSRYWESLAAIECYGKLFGDDEFYWERKARYLALAGYPTEALQITAPRIEAKPGDFENLVTYTIAAQRLKCLEKAICGYQQLLNMEPDRSEVTDIANVLFTPLRSYLFEDIYYYHDNQTLEQLETNTIGAVALTHRTKALGGIQTFSTRAAPFSGLNQRNGKKWAAENYFWLGFEHLFCSRLFLGFRGGRGWTNAQGGLDIPAYDFFLFYPVNDILDVGFNSHYGFYNISPRSLSFHVRRWANEFFLQWRPSLLGRIDVFANFDTFTDGNKRWNLDLLPRLIAIRSEHVLLEFGIETRWYGFKEDLQHGYFDPNFYQRYVTTTYFYYYINDENGFDGTLFLGVEKSNGRKPSHYLSATGHMFLGLYEDIYFQLKGKVTSSQSSVGGAVQFRNFFAAEIEAIVTYRF